jgi:hypothetical protein
LFRGHIVHPLAPYVKNGHLGKRTSATHL